MMFLTPQELEQLTGYTANQRKRICAWLDDNGYPYTTNRLGEPVVLRSDVEREKSPSTEPKLNWLISA